MINWLIPKRHAEVADWLRTVGLLDKTGPHGRPERIPFGKGALVVSPINEGELLVEYLVFDDRINDLSIPLKSILDEDGHIPEYPRTAVVTEAPPGFRLPKWDGFEYIQAQP